MGKAGSPRPAARLHVCTNRRRCSCGVVAAGNVVSAGWTLLRPFVDGGAGAAEGAASDDADEDGVAGAFDDDDEDGADGISEDGGVLRRLLLCGGANGSSSDDLLEMGPPSVQALERAVYREFHEKQAAAAVYTEHNHWRVYRKWERFWAPFVLNMTNAGLVWSTAWCMERGLWMAAFGFGYLLIASVVLHTYRDWPHFPGRRSPPLAATAEFLMLLDYCAAFNLCGVVWIHQTSYTHPWLSQSVLYTVNFLLACLLTAFNGEKMAFNGALMTVIGMAVAAPAMLAAPENYNLLVLAAVMVIQPLGFTCLLYLQYHMPYWMAHSFWHVTGCIATFLMLTVPKHADVLLDAAATTPSGAA